MTILDRIQTSLGQLADSEAKVARVVLDNPSLLEHYTITTLAQTSETSTSAVLRFCHTLGFNGYKDFRYALAAELREEAGANRSSDPTREALRGMAEAIDALGELMTPELELFAKQIAHSSPVFCLGIHRSFLPAEKLRMDLADLNILALSARDTVEMTHLANLTSDQSCTIIFSASGTLGNYRAALDAGLASQGNSWLVTSSTRAPLSAHVDHTMTLPSAHRIGAAMVDEHPVAMAFVEMLVQVVKRQQNDS